MRRSHPQKPTGFVFEKHLARPAVIVLSSNTHALPIPNRSSYEVASMPLEHLMQATISTDPDALSTHPLSADELRKINAYWRAANYISVGQIYLYANPLLTEPLRLEHIKPRLLGHWGTTPGLNFIYVHCNRLIRKY